MKEIKALKINIHILRRLAVAAFGLLICICTAFVMLKMYDSNQNSIGALSSVCMDIICIIILFILIVSFAFGKYMSSSNTTKLFMGLLIATIWAVFLDFLNWSFDGSLEYGHLTFWFTAGSLCMGSILACIFSLYIYSYMKDTHNLTKIRKSAFGCAIINLISFVITFILAITKTAFNFVNGHYETGTLYGVVTAIPVLTLLYLTGYIISSVRKIGLHDVIAATGYIILMVTGALIEEEYGIGTTYVAVTIANIFIFAMLQNEIIALEKRNVQTWKEISNKDELTGFYNRHAYEADMSVLERNELEDDFVYVSADVNSLKNINDTLGHSAGDELLVGASECLKRCFGPYGKLYRIGGDEFIAIIFVDEEHLNIAKKEIEELASDWKGKIVGNLTISCGYVSKSEVNDMPVRQIAVLADKRMYEAKDEYYRSAGIERRKY